MTNISPSSYPNTSYIIVLVLYLLLVIVLGSLVCF